MPFARPSLLLLSIPLLPAVLGGCGLAPAVQASLGAVGGTTAAGHIPTTDIHQIYYIGVFDPRDQLPPTIYRIRVRGQSSALNSTKFASGWVRADLIDSLSGKYDAPRTADGEAVTEERGLLTGRRLMMFGPEGFREAPRNHRLVVVMGASPEKFFAAVDEALGVVAQVTQGGQGPQIERALYGELSRLALLRRKVDVVVDAARED